MSMWLIIRSRLAEFLKFLLILFLISGISGDFEVFATTSPTQPLSVFETIPEVSVERFEIEGNSLEQLLRELNEKGPVDLYQKRRHAHTAWRISWDWPYDDSMKPLFNRTQVTTEITVALPNWVPPTGASSFLITRWNQFLAHLVAHELGHVEIALKIAGEISKEIKQVFAQNPALTEKEAHAIGKAILKKIHQADRRYDKKTKSGLVSGVSLR